MCCFSFGRPSHSAFTNEFFASACHSWRDRLQDGKHCHCFKLNFFQTCHLEGKIIVKWSQDMMMLVLLVGFKIIKMAFQLLQSQSRINTPNNHSGRKGLCSTRKYPYPPPRKGGHFCLRPPPPRNFHSMGCLSHPATPWNFRDFPS